MTRLMSEFPPPRDQLVTLANWRRQPYSDWSFHNVRRLLPTANITASSRPSPLELAPIELGQVAFKGIGGSKTTLHDFLRNTRTKSFVVLHRGRIATEFYSLGMNATTPHIVFSVSKSITAALGGILADKGYIDPERPVTDYVPEVAASVYGSCKVRHLLDMTVGISFVEDYLDPDGDVARYRLAVGWDAMPPGKTSPALREFLGMQKPDGKPHGETFHYVSTNTDLLGWVYERAAKRAYSDLLGEYLWTPMGAQTDAYITLDSEGAMRTAGGICTAPHDLARFGEMIRRRGVANGKQVVPGWWIDDIVENGNPAAWARGEFATMFPGASYRSKFYQIDRKRHTLLAWGIHCQFIYIDPPSEVVIVRNGADEIPADEESVMAWRRAFDSIAARFS